jgi:hypothetical protein
MRRRPGVEVPQNSLEDYVMQNAQGIPVLLETQPTTDNALLLLPVHGDRGWYGNDMYENRFGQIIKFTGATL